MKTLEKGQEAKTNSFRKLKEPDDAEGHRLIGKKVKCLRCKFSGELEPHDRIATGYGSHGSSLHVACPNSGDSIFVC